MKNSLKLLLPVLALALVPAASLLRAEDTPASPAAPAAPAKREHPGRGDRLHHRMKMLSERLKLTDDQKAKLAPILQSEGDQLKAIRDDASLTREQKRDKARAVQQASKPQIRALLTPEQQKQLDEMKDQRRERREDGDKPAGPPPAQP